MWPADLAALATGTAAKAKLVASNTVTAFVVIVVLPGVSDEVLFPRFITLSVLRRDDPRAPAECVSEALVKMSVTSSLWEYLPFSRGEDFFESEEFRKNFDGQSSHPERLALNWGGVVCAIIPAGLHSGKHRTRH